MTSHESHQLTPGARVVYMDGRGIQYHGEVIDVTPVGTVQRYTDGTQILLRHEDAACIERETAGVAT